MRVVLFGLTGFGNAALRGCRGVAEVVAVFTRHERGPFPYYPQTHLAAEAKATGIPVIEVSPADVAGPPTALGDLAPDVLLVATYHRRIPAAWITGVPCGGINIHPSLLPAYRGATPTAWCLLNGEKETGVTAHYLTDRIDEGPIIVQRRVPIASDDTDGTLRQKLAKTAEGVVRAVLQQMAQGERPLGIPQDESRGSIFPRRTAGDAQIVFDRPSTVIYDRIRANLPYPGPRTVIAGRAVRILAAESCRVSTEQELPGTIVQEGPGWADVRTLDGVIRVRLISEGPAADRARSSTS